MKTFYQNAEMEIVSFEIEDVIATSGLDQGTNDDDSYGGLN